MFHGVGLYRPATAIIAVKCGIQVTGVDIIQGL